VPAAPSDTPAPAAAGAAEMEVLDLEIPDLEIPDLEIPDLEVLDMEVLQQLARDLDAELLADVIRQFVEETLERAERIARGGAEAAEGNPADLAGLAKEAHTLKSTAGTFGARDLSAAARALELACRSNAVGEVTSLCRDIPRLTREAVEAYRLRGYVTS